MTEAQKTTLSQQWGEIMFLLKNNALTSEEALKQARAQTKEGLDFLTTLEKAANAA